MARVDVYDWEPRQVHHLVTKEEDNQIGLDFGDAVDDRVELVEGYWSWGV